MDKKAMSDILYTRLFLYIDEIDMFWQEYKSFLATPGDFSYVNEPVRFHVYSKVRKGTNAKYICYPYIKYKDLNIYGGRISFDELQEVCNNFTYFENYKLVLMRDINGSYHGGMAIAFIPYNLMEELTTDTSNDKKRIIVTPEEAILLLDDTVPVSIKQKIIKIL